jgi:serine/threonine protein phosphatase PrpC
MLTAPFINCVLQALFAGFLEADKACRSRHRVSGTTATLALVVGWELLVANVGDSAAFLDTGKEVIALSGNHRIDDNTAERARIEAAGGACCKGVAVAVHS